MILLLQKCKDKEKTYNEDAFKDEVFSVEAFVSHRS